MRFSLFLNARSVTPDEDRFVMQNMVSHALLAEDAGFEAVFMPDHHFTGYAPWASDPMMFAAWLAPRFKKKTTVGFSVTSVPLHSPVRFVERVNLLDQMTEGRVLVGVGSGTTPEEMIGFGVNYSDASAISDRNLDIAEALWAKTPDSPPVEFENGPWRGRVLQRIAPEPFTKGHAPLMPVAFKEASIRRAVDHCWPAFIPAFSPPVINNLEPYNHVRKHFTKYRDLLLAAGHDRSKIDFALGWTTHTYQCVHLAPSADQARDELETILRSYQEAVNRENEFAAKAETDASNRKKDVNLDALTDEWIATWCLYGTPDQVIAHLEPYSELGIGNVLCGTTTGPLTEQRLQLAGQTVKLMGEKVIPHFSARQAIAA